MKKNWTCVLIVLVMALSAGQLFAAGAKEATGAKQYLIAYSQAELVNAWRVTEPEGHGGLAQKLGVKLISLTRTRIPRSSSPTSRTCWPRNPMRSSFRRWNPRRSCRQSRCANRPRCPSSSSIGPSRLTRAPGSTRPRSRRVTSFPEKLLAEKTVELLTKKNG